MKRYLISIALLLSATCVFAEDAQKPADNEAAKKANHQKNVCYYAGQSYTEGSVLKMGNTLMACESSMISTLNAPETLRWQPSSLETKKPVITGKNK